MSAVSRAGAASCASCAVPSGCRRGAERSRKKVAVPHTLSPRPLQALCPSPAPHTLTHLLADLDRRTAPAGEEDAVALLDGAGDDLAVLGGAGADGDDGGLGEGRLGGGRGEEDAGGGLLLELALQGGALGTGEGWAGAARGVWKRRRGVLRGLRHAGSWEKRETKMKRVVWLARRPRGRLFPARAEGSRGQSPPPDTGVR
jgi:hypothetical protein